MRYLFLALTVVLVSLQSACAKEYNKKRGGPLMYAAINVFFAILVFLLSFFVTTDGRFHLSWETLRYSLLFAVSYGGATIGTIFAIRYGSLSLTSLLTSFSLLIPTFYGIWALKEETGALLYGGLVLLLVSLLLVNLEKKENKTERASSPNSLKWVVCVALSFVGNGVCATTQKVQQIHQQGMYKNEFMIVALSIVCLVTLILSLIVEKNPLKSIKDGIVSGGIRGLANGAANLLVLTLALSMSASVMFPVISGGGIALTSVIALTVYREKLSAKQILGLILGIASVVLLNV